MELAIIVGLISHIVVDHGRQSEPDHGGGGASGTLLFFDLKIPSSWRRRKNFSLSVESWHAYPGMSTCREVEISFLGMMAPDWKFSSRKMKKLPIYRRGRGTTPLPAPRAPRSVANIRSLAKIAVANIRSLAKIAPPNVLAHYATVATAHFSLYCKLQIRKCAFNFIYGHEFQQNNVHSIYLRLAAVIACSVIQFHIWAIKIIVYMHVHSIYTHKITRIMKKHIHKHSYVCNTDK